MKIAERIAQQVDVEKLLQHYNAQRVKRSGIHVRCNCPIHGGDNPSAFVFNTETKLWYCHTGCNAGGDIFNFVMVMEDVDFMRSAELIAEMFDIEVDWDALEVEESQFADEAQAFIKQHKQRLAEMVQLPEYKIDCKVARIKDFRNYSAEAITFWKLYLAKTGDLSDRVIIPLDDSNKRLVGCSGRRTKADQAAKWMHKPDGMKTGHILAGLGRNKTAILEKMELIVTEGLFDAIRVWDYGYRNVASTLSANMTERQVREIQKVAFSVILAFDNDVAGRNATRKAIELLGNNTDIRIIDIPSQFKDVDELSKEQFDQAYKNRLMVHEWIEKYGAKKEKTGGRK